MAPHCGAGCAHGGGLLRACWRYRVHPGRSGRHLVLHFSTRHRGHSGGAESGAPGIGQLLALLVSFCGLALMLGVSFEAADPKGIMLALGAALCVAWNTVWTARKLSHLDGAVVVFHMGVVSAVVLSGICLLTDMPSFR